MFQSVYAELNETRRRDGQEHKKDKELQEIKILISINKGSCGVLPMHRLIESRQASKKKASIANKVRAASAEF